MSSNSVRRRKLTQDESGNVTTRRKNSRKSNHHGLILSFMSLILCVVILTTFLGLYTDSLPPIIDGIAGKLGYSEKTYAVIIDAGSTGSRVLAYEFHKGYLDGRLILDSELFIQMKPGLSSFADDPKLGVIQIKELLEEAKSFIPPNMWKSSPLVLKATAGLRLLDPVKADNLLNAVRAMFDESGFHVEKNSVEIMDGTDEGIFSWFTVNFLLGKLSTDGSTVAALDLGGGSTQVTFVPKDPAQTPLFKEYMHTVPSLNKNIEVFTHSYLNLGLMAVRHAVFTHNVPENETTITSECVNSIVSGKSWKYVNKYYSVSGKINKKSRPENPEVDFNLCLESVKRKVITLVKPRPITLKQHQIAAFSYYFERAIEVGLIDPFEGGEITVGSFRQKAQEICAIPNTDQPFMCLDLTFISVLLENGYGLSSGTTMKLYKQINGHEISWALGCAYNILTKPI